MKKTKVAIVDDHPLIIEGLKLLFSNSENYEITASFHSGEALYAYEAINTIDVLLLDVFLQDDNGIDVCLKIKKIY